MSPFYNLCVVLVCFLYIHKCEAAVTNVVVKVYFDNKVHRVLCKGPTNVTVSEGDTIHLITNSTLYLHFASLNITKKDGSILKEFDKKSWEEFGGKMDYKIPNLVSVQHSGYWTFDFLTDGLYTPFYLYNNKNYTVSSCYIQNVEVQIGTPLWVWIIVGVGIFVIIVILGQTAIIIYLKKKAQLLLRDQNLKPKNSSGDDTTRYSLTPRASKAKKKKRGDSGIYETLEDIKLQNQGAPLPPAIDTLPGKGGSKHLPGTMEKKQLLPTIPGSPKPNHINTDESRHDAERIKDRPPLPLPCAETYEEIGTEENTYEPPPVIPSSGHIRARPPATNKLPAAFPIPLTLPGQRMERPSKTKQPEKPIKAEKPKPAKPVKPAKLPKPGKPEKPSVKPMMSDPNPKVVSELDNLLKKRRNDSNPPLMVNELDNILKKRRDVAENTTAVAPPVATASNTAAASLPRIPPKSPVVARPSASNTNTQTRNKAVAPNSHGVVPPAAAVMAAAPPLPRLPPNSPAVARPTASDTNTQTRNKAASPFIAKPPCPLPAPAPIPVPVTSQNDEPNSSDEEWTYEVLPQYNIYSM